MIGLESKKQPGGHTTKIVEWRKLNDELTLLRFTQDLSAAQPGQYCMVGLPQFDEKPFMVFKARPLELIVQSRGPFTQLISSAEFSHNLTLRGPFGTGFSLPDQTDHSCALLINSVAGLSAQLHLLSKLQEHNFKDMQIFVTAALMGALKIILNTDLQVIEYQEAELRSVIKSLQAHTEHLYFSATTQAMLQIILEEVDCSSTLLSAQGIFVNNYIACAIGICGRCAQEGLLSGKLPCTEGPVFDVLKL